MKNHKLITIVILMIIWQLLAIFIAKDYIIPSPKDTFIKMLEISLSLTSYHHIFLTIARSLVAMLFAWLSSNLLIFIYIRFDYLRKSIEMVNSLFKGLPNISIIIILFMWFKASISIIIIVFIVICPLMLDRLIIKYHELEQQYTKLIDVYQPNTMTKYLASKIYYPLLKNDRIINLFSFVSLSFKITVMAEVLSQIKFGIGKQIYLSKIMLDMSNVFAWTILLVIFIYLIEVLINRFILHNINYAK